MTPPGPRGTEARHATLAGWVLAIVSIAAGAFFFTSLGRLWPLADLELLAPSAGLRAQAREFLERRGFDLEGYRSASALTVDTRGLNYVERAFGRSQAQRWIAEGYPLVQYRVDFKKRGERTEYSVRLHPEAGLLSWRKWVEDDEPGPRLPAEQALRAAELALTEGLGLELSAYEARSDSSTEQIDRRDHSFGFERRVSEEPELREWIQVSVAGDQVVAASRSLRVPGEARRAARAAEAPGRALETLGFLLLAIGALAAFVIFLRRLRDGTAELGRAWIWPAAVFVCLIGTYALETSSLFRYWEPLWPKWVSDFQYLSFRGLEGVLIVLLLLTVVSAGDALDREGGYRRGAALWTLARGRLFDPMVGRASGRGFLVGLLCGGVMTGAVVLLQWAAQAETAIQPRGFFFYTLNSASPLAASLLFFFGVALAEELGYRFFAGTWFLALTGRRWVAVLLPALIYGLTHTRLDFLPPAEPWWGRALVLTLVGCVWGWAFLRYDALTVVLSHFTADLFIFNWPRLGSGQLGPVLGSLLVICVPLIPALGWSVSRLLGGSGRARS